MEENTVFVLVLGSIAIAAIVLLLISIIFAWTASSVHKGKDEATKFVAQQATERAQIEQEGKKVKAASQVSVVDTKCNAQLQLKDKDVKMHRESVDLTKSAQRMKVERTTIKASALIAASELRCNTDAQIADKENHVRLKGLKYWRDGQMARLETKERLAVASNQLEQRRLQTTETVAEIGAGALRYETDRQCEASFDWNRTQLEAHTAACSSRERLAQGRNRLQLKQAKLASAVMHEQIRDDRSAREDLLNHERFVQSQETQRTEIRETARIMTAGMDLLVPEIAIVRGLTGAGAGAAGVAAVEERSSTFSSRGGNRGSQLLGQRGLFGEGASSILSNSLLRSARGTAGARAAAGPEPSTPAFTRPPLPMERLSIDNGGRSTTVEELE